MSRSDAAGGWVFLAVIGVAVWYFGIRDSDWLARSHARQKYSVPDSRVQIAGTRPHDCDFWTAPLGIKRCSYERQYLADWFTLRNNLPVVYGNDQATPPLGCSSNELDFAHACYPINDLKPDEHPSAQWSARSVEIRWHKVEE
jgi:hypothetical protein